MSLGRVPYFITIAETGNITKAAQILRVSQPSLSQYLTRLEAEVGMPLLHRNCTPIRLTEAGKIYLEYVKQLVKAEASFHRQLSELEQAKRTRLQIAIPFQVIPQVFERFLRGFYSAYPNIDVTIKEGTSISAFQMLMDEREELAFFHSVEAEDPRLNRLILDKTELFFICNRSHPLVAGRESSPDAPISITEEQLPLLEQMLFFRPSSEYYLHHVFTKYLNELNVTPCNIREVSNLSAILAYINDVGNDALTLSSEFALQDPAVRHGNLAFFHVKEHPAYWYFTLNAPAEGELSYAGKLFWSFVSQVLNAKPEPNSF